EKAQGPRAPRPRRTMRRPTFDLRPWALFPRRWGGGPEGPLPVTSRGLDRGDVDLLAVGDDEVQDLHRRLVDVVLDLLGLAVEDGEPDEADDGDAEAEGRAVHRLGDAVGEDGRLLAGVDAGAGDRAEGLDQAGHGPEQAAQHGQVGEQREVGGAGADL